MAILRSLLLNTRWGRQRTYRLLKEGYARKWQRYKNDRENVLPSTRAKQERELEQIADAIKAIEERDAELDAAMRRHPAGKKKGDPDA
jgi:hypothetical protein